MKNIQKGFIVPALVIIILILLVVGGIYVYQNEKLKQLTVGSATPQKDIQNSSVNTKTDTLSSNQTHGYDQKVLSVAREVIVALSARDYQKLEQLTSPDGLSINLSPSFDSKKNLISKNSVSDISHDTQIYLWGYMDGKGDPINLTRKGVLTEWIYTNAVDYLKASQVAVNKKLGEGNSLNTIKEDVGTRTYVAFHFPGFDPKYGGLDWTTLYLIFDWINGEYKLRGIAKDNWTI